MIGRAALTARAKGGDASRGVSIELGHLDLPVAGQAKPQAASAPMPVGDLRAAIEDYQRELISAALRRSHGSLAAAARELGLDRANLRRLASRLGVERSASVAKGQ